MDALADTRPRAEKIIAVLGPTATGKTELTFGLCKAFGGEMVGADSMQVYRGLPVGTAAPRPEECPAVPRHLIGVLPPEIPFSVADYVANAAGIIAHLHSIGKTPVLCGGTGLYIESLVNGLDFAEVGMPQNARVQMEAEWDEAGAAEMLRRLAALDPEHAAKLHLNDKKRILNALWQTREQRATYAERAARSRPAEKPYDALLIGVDARDRALLYKRIEARVNGMLAGGLLDEAKTVYEHRKAYKTAAQAIGYKEFFPYFAGGAPLDACAEKLKQATRNYAKRQLTWFRRMKDVHWLFLEDGGLEETASALTEAFLRGE